MDDVITLFRPVGPKELALIEASGWQSFPPRMPEQPIFYPVISESYAAWISRHWNVRDHGSGYVTRFAVRAEYVRRYPVQRVGAGAEELWIPAEDLAEFNRNLVGPIEVIGEFHGSQGDAADPADLRRQAVRHPATAERRPPGTPWQPSASSSRARRSPSSSGPARGRK